MDPDHILHGLLNGSSDIRQKRLRSRRPFVPDARRLLDNLAKLGIRASQWKNYWWHTQYCKSTRRLCAFIPMTSIRPVESGLLLGDSIRPCTNASSPHYEWGATEQTADHVLQRAP